MMNSNNNWAENGSVQNIAEIPDNLKALYKTAYELKQKVIIDMAADRGAFICQSQSLNLFVENPNFGKLSSMHFYGWQAGLKTGIYYLRSKAAVDPIKFTLAEKHQRIGSKNANNTVTIDVEASSTRGTATQRQQAINPDTDDTPQVCNLDDPDCLMCGS